MNEQTTAQVKQGLYRCEGDQSTVYRAMVNTGLALHDEPKGKGSKTKARTLDVQYLFGLLQRDAGLGIGRGVRCAGTSSTSPASGLLASGVFLFESFGQCLADYLRADDYYLHDILGHGSNVVPRSAASHYHREPRFK